MSLFIPIILLLSFTQDIIAQDASCTCAYSTVASYGYTSRMNITNPDGFDNFTSVSGEHLESRSDDDVLSVLSEYGANSLNIPSIICEQYKNLVTIELLYIGIEIVDEHSLEKCVNLQRLSLMNNKIVELPENVFIENSKLTYLSLAHNPIKTLPVNILASQSLLRELDFWFCPIEELPDGIFDSLVNLETLNLNGNELTELPVGIFRNFFNIEIFSMSDNRLTTLHPEWFENSLKIRGLQIQGNQFLELPKNVFTPLINLNFMYLYSNNLTTIHSDSFGFHVNFTHLYFSKNNLESIDERFIENNALRTVEAGPNPCVDRNGVFGDSTENRTDIKLALQRCFDNYREREDETTTTTTTEDSDQCEMGNLDRRVCNLEENELETQDEIEKLKYVNSALEKELNATKDDFTQKLKTLDEKIQLIIDNCECNSSKLTNNVFILISIVSTILKF